MNGCVWCFLCCDGCLCNGCNKYISVNSELGKELVKTYNQEVNEVLEPLKDKWKNKMSDYKGD